MAFNPTDPFFETTIANLIDQRIGQSQISSLVRQLQGAQVAGAGSLHFAANNISNVLTVTHGLGTVPTSILCTGADTGDSRFVGFGVKNLTATTFDVSARDWAGSTVTKDLPFYWLAVR